MERRMDEAMLTVRLPVQLREAIERSAAEQHRTVSGQTRYLLATAIERQALQPRAA
jgi:hypothetical protein